MILILFAFTGTHAHIYIVQQIRHVVNIIYFTMLYIKKLFVHGMMYTKNCYIIKIQSHVAIVLCTLLKNEFPRKLTKLKFKELSIIILFKNAFIY